MIFPTPDASFQTSGSYDLVICDIDGCLSPESHDPFNVEGLASLSEYNRRAIGERDRPVVTLCSGRPIGFVECLCRLIQNTVFPTIGENGVWLWRPDDNTFELDPNITEEHLEIVHEAKKLLRSLYQSRGVIQQPGKTASVALYHADTDYLRSLMPEIEAEFEKRNWPLRVSMTWLYINCDLQHVSKATAIDRLITETGVSLERAAGIGDTMGDRFIAERVSWFGCPANAETEITEAAAFVSSKREVEGVLDILDHLRR